MKSRLRSVRDGDVVYSALLFVCPGYDGIHMLPVNVQAPSGFKKPSWDWDGNLEAPTLSPSILTNKDRSKTDARNEDGTYVYPRCHSFLRGGIFEFLSDCEHPLAGQKVPIPDLPEWAENLS